MGLTPRRTKSQPNPMMKAIILAAVAVTVLASALWVQAAERPAHADKFFEDIAKRGGQ